MVEAVVVEAAEAAAEELVLQPHFHQIHYLPKQQQQQQLQQQLQ